MNTAPAMVKTSAYAEAPVGTWFVTCNPQKSEGCIELHFDREKIEREAFSLSQVIDKMTGATWYTLDGVHHTVESLAEVGKFTLPLSTYSIGTGFQRVLGQENIAPLEAWLVARGDDAAAQKLRGTFPQLFAPPTPVPSAPKPHPQRRRRRRWWPL